MGDEHGNDGPWYGFDLDGTLAEYHGWDHGRIGAPVPAMVEKAKALLAAGKSVRIVTARVSNDASPEERVEQRVRIQRWCQEHLGTILGVTSEKDFGMIALYDDRCVAVEKNTGKLLSPEEPFL